jgi:fatty acid desaturase
MHKQHHTYTNHIELDPELTSYFPPEVLSNPGFRNVSLSRQSYFNQFVDIFYTFKSRLGRIVNSALGVPVDYSGVRWSLKGWSLSEETGVMRKLQASAILQLSVYFVVFLHFGRSVEGIQTMLFWWIAPVILGYPAVNFFRNLEHANCEVSKVSNCLRNTRSVRSNALIRLLLWDTNYHAVRLLNSGGPFLLLPTHFLTIPWPLLVPVSQEHHCYPMVPFYNLEKLHELMREHIVHNEQDHFTSQNFAAVRRGGWIDQQATSMKAHHTQNYISNLRANKLD